MTVPAPNYVKEKNLLLGRKPSKSLLLVVFALVAFFALKETGIFSPAKAEDWIVARLVRQLNAKPSFFDSWREALWKVTPPRWESVRELLLPPDYANGRRQAALLLGARGSSASNAVSALVLAIGRENIPVVAHEEFTALGRIGPGASEAVPALLAWLTRPDPVPAQLAGMKIWEQGAAWALVRIAPEDPRVSAGLISALASCGIEKDRPFLTGAEFMEPGDLRGVPYNYGQGWPSTRRCLIRAIGKLRPQTSQTLAVLFHELRSTNYAAQATAADVLGQIRTVSSETISELREALLRTEAEHLPEWRDLAALTPPYLDNAHAALFKENPAPEVRMIFGEEPIIPKEHLDTIYLPGADFPGWGLRLRVIRALGQIGPPAHDALPSLLKECENETKPWRFDAAVAIWRISGDGPEAIAVFEHGLHAADLESRQLAVARLSEIGAEFPKALTLLSSGLQDPALQIRVEVLASLAALGTNSTPVLPAIEALTNDRMFRMRDAATQAIYAIQPPIPKK